VLVLMNFFSRNLAADNAAEKAIRVIHAVDLHAAHLRNDSILMAKLSAALSLPDFVYTH
jgi:hypothetical protein